MGSGTKTPAIALFEGAVTGIGKHITTNVTVGGVAYTPVVLSGIFSGAVTALQTAESLHTQWLDAVKAARATVAQARVVYKPFKQFVLGQFGDNQTVLDDFDITVSKPAVPTAATKAAAVLKSKATKEARGTTGKKQKQSVKGSVQVEITAVPVVTTPAPAAPPAPVAPAASAAAPAPVNAKSPAG
jgi:hypothetical protein